MPELVPNLNHFPEFVLGVTERLITESAVHLTYTPFHKESRLCVYPKICRAIDAGAILLPAMNPENPEGFTRLGASSTGFAQRRDNGRTDSGRLGYK